MDLAGFLGTARAERFVEEPERTTTPGGTQTELTKQIRSLGVLWESAGLIVVGKRGNSRGAKGPFQLHVIQESSYSLG